MARNLSVDQFKDLMANIPKVVAEELQGAVFDQAKRLSEAQRSAANVKSGTYRASHRVEQGRHPLQAKVMAGGPTTTKKDARGRQYDYAAANEFGTKEMSAQPSFWPMYRLHKKSVRAAINRRAKKAIMKVVNLK